jgi:uncharacterized membrane protein
MITLLGMLLLYYFDLRRDAFLVATTHLTTCIAATAGAWALGLPPGVGFVTASLPSTAIALRLVNRRLQKLVVETFQSQPYTAELAD